MSTFLHAIAVVALALAVQARPNVILFMPDDMNFYWPEAPAATNNPGGLTTNFDQVRNDGIVFTSAYTAGVMCAPARFNLMTGRYCSRSEHANTRANSNTDTRITVTVPRCKITGGDNARTVASLLSAQGYRTIFSGKWHLDTSSDWNDYPGSWADVAAAGFTHDGGTYISNMNGVLSFSHNMEWNVALTRGHIQDAVAANEEFFVYFAGTMPHSPSVSDSLAVVDGILQTPAGPLQTAPVSGLPSRTDILNFATANGLNDQQLGTYVTDLALGALLTEVEDQGATANTMVICLMDHGMLDKSDITEGGTRIAMFAKYPGAFDPNLYAITAHVTNLDIAATILEAAAVTAPTDLDGESWYQAAQGTGSVSTRYIVSEDEQNRAVVSPTGIKVVNRVTAGGDTTTLYDLATDPGFVADGKETTDRSGEAGYATVLAELNAVLACHDANTGFTPANPQLDCTAAAPSPAPPPPAPTTPAPTTAAPVAAPVCCRGGEPLAATRPYCNSGRPMAQFCP
eukprot:m.83313 g.83313  ORF g.83313 m.83313 type:complete len:514 (-) comp11187_c0_seq1:193-1734(-)